MQKTESTDNTVELPYAIKSEPTNWKGVLCIAGGISLMIYLGCFFLWGNISLYVLSYYYQTNHDLAYNFIFLVDTFLILSNWCGY